MVRAPEEKDYETEETTIAYIKEVITNSKTNAEFKLGMLRFVLGGLPPSPTS